MLHSGEYLRHTGHPGNPIQSHPTLSTRSGEKPGRETELILGKANWNKVNCNTAFNERFILPCGIEDKKESLQ